MRHGPSPAGRRVSHLLLGSPAVPEDLQSLPGPGGRRGDWIRLDWQMIKGDGFKDNFWDNFWDNYINYYVG